MCVCVCVCLFACETIPPGSPVITLIHGPLPRYPPPPVHFTAKFLNFEARQHACLDSRTQEGVRGARHYSGRQIGHPNKTRHPEHGTWMQHTHVSWTKCPTLLFTSFHQQFLCYSFIMITSKESEFRDWSQNLESEFCRKGHPNARDLNAAHTHVLFNVKHSCSRVFPTQQFLCYSFIMISCKKSESWNSQKVRIRRLTS